MRTRTLLALSFLLLASVPGLDAQGWDPGTQATGWAFQDVDGSLFFYDAGSRALRQWQKGGGLLATQTLPLPPARKAPAPKVVAPAPVDASGSAYESAGALLYGIPAAQRTQVHRTKPAPKAEPAAEATCDAVPERWVLDTANRIWVVCEERLVVIERNGQMGATYPLPGPVEDLAADHDGIYLNYRTIKPYVEKRSLKDGQVAWTYGDKGALREASALPLLVALNRMTLAGDGALYLAEGGGLAFTVLDADKGPAAPGQSFFTYRGSVASRVNLGRTGRGPLLPWAGKDVLFSAFSGAQLKGSGAPDAKGVVLARFDLAKGALDWIPTGLTEGHRLVGLLEHEAVFLNPEGGLSYAPIH
jgi:hypothetical protein